MNYARAIKICRAAFEMEQKELAESLGVTPSYLSLIESGKRKPSVDRLNQLCAIFGIPLELLMLLGGSEGHGNSSSEALDDITTSLLELMVYTKGDDSVRFTK